MEASANPAVCELCRLAMPILSAMSGAVAVVDATGAVVFSSERASAEWRAIAGRPDEVWAYRGYDVHGEPIARDQWPLRRTLATGERVLGQEIRAEFPSGGHGVVRLSSSPVVAADGTLLGAVVEMLDVTEEHRHADALRFLADASSLLAESTLDAEETLQRLARLAVPRLADWCAIDLVDEQGGLQTVVVAHTDPAKVEMARDLRARRPSDPRAATGPAAVIRSGRSELVAEITEELLTSSIDDPEVLALARDLGLYSSLVVPLEAGGERFGALTLVSAEQRRRFDQEDMAVAEDLGHRAALAIQAARRFADEERVAAALQAALLPAAVPALAGVEVSVAFRPSGAGVDVGGDFYDVWTTDGGFGFVVGDVQGKGPEAAAVTALARHVIRSTARRGHSPAEALSVANQELVAAGMGRFCTAVAGDAVRTADGYRLVVARAGHPYPLIRRVDGELEQAGGDGMLLGIDADVRCADATAVLGPGDVLVVYTDGVTDRRRGEEHFGEQAVRRLIGHTEGPISAAEVVKLLEAAVVGYGPDSPQDDIALLALRVSDD